MADQQASNSNICKVTVNTSLFKNVVKHTEAHNKVQEVNEMWRQHKASSKVKSKHSDRRKRKANYTRSMVPKPDSTYWTKQLLNAEEADPDRWGHAGYKELYPEEFTPSPISLTTSSSSDDSISNRKRKKTTKRKKKKSKKKKKKESKKKKKSYDSQ